MASVKKTKEVKVETVPYKCYSCQLYDGSFGPDNDAQHVHVCEKCKGLPADLSLISRHVEEYHTHRPEFGENNLACERCGQERDTCLCRDNPVLHPEAVGMVVDASEDDSEEVSEDDEEEVEEDGGPRAAPVEGMLNQVVEYQLRANIDPQQYRVIRDPF